MPRWNDLTRRQQIWSLKRQHDAMETLRARRDGPIGDIDDEARRAMSPSCSSCEPIDQTSARMIEHAYRLEEGSLDPLRAVPEHETIVDPEEPDVTYVLDAYVDDGRRVPSGPVVAGVLRALDRGIDMARIVRASGIEARMIDESMKGERRSVPHAVMERISVALRDERILRLADSAEEVPYLLMAETDGGTRLVINARMDRSRAETIAELVRDRTRVVIEPSTGPSPRPVVLRVDAVMPRGVVDAVVARLMSRRSVERRL